MRRAQLVAPRTLHMWPRTSEKSAKSTAWLRLLPSQKAQSSAKADLVRVRVRVRIGMRVRCVRLRVRVGVRVEDRARVRSAKADSRMALTASGGSLA